MTLLRAVLLFVGCASALQHTGGRLQLPRSASVTSVERPSVSPRVGVPRAGFGGPEKEGGLTRDSEPEEFFKTKGGLSDDMTDAEKFKSPAFFIGIGLIITPFLAGLIALFVAK